jgi:hypothetical protein
MNNLITITALSAIQVGVIAYNATLVQVQAWDVNDKTVYSVLVSILLTAIIVLWNSNKRKDEEIKKLNQFVIEKIEKLSDHNNHG